MIFSYKDIDEVKKQRFNKKLLKMLYAKQNKMNSKKMDYWNMHNIAISPNRITLIKINDSYYLTDILLWIVKNTNLDLKTFFPYLYEFLTYYGLLEKKKG